MVVGEFGSRPQQKYLSCHGGIEGYLRVALMVSVYGSARQKIVLISGSVEHNIESFEL